MAQQRSFLTRTLGAALVAYAGALAAIFWHAGR
jgi:hypothetical protein